MKKILSITVAILILVGGVAGGLSVFAHSTAKGEGEYVQPPLEEHLTIDLGVGGTYKYVLDVNPSVGYQWLVEMDGTAVDLVDRYFEIDSGKEVFIFRGLEGGTTDVTFTYKRPNEQVTFKVDGDAVGGKLTLAQAMEIATNSVCVLDGTLTGEPFYNKDTGTWWIDLDARDQKEYCNPACVVSEATGKAAINGRCMGALPPLNQDPIDGELDLVPDPAESGDSVSQAQAIGHPPSPAPVLWVGDTYALLLDSNPTTGYQWQVEFDESLLELVDQRYEPGWGNVVGAGGKEVFVFRGLAVGIADVGFTYKRPWENKALKTEWNTINVKGDVAGDPTDGELKTERITFNFQDLLGLLEDVASDKDPTEVELKPLPVTDGVPLPPPDSEALTLTIVPATIPVPLPEESIQIAKQYLLDSPSFDGVEESVKLAHIAAARCPLCWAFTFHYETEDGTAKATIMVEQGKVTSANFGN